MEDLLGMMRRQAARDARGDSNGDRRVTARDLRNGEGNAYAGYIKGKVKFPARCPAPAKPATGPSAPVKQDAAEKAMGLPKGTLTRDHGDGLGYTPNQLNGVTSLRLYVLRGPIQFRPYLLERKGYKGALQIKVDAGMIVVVGKAKTKTVPAHWRVELHCGKDIVVLHTGFNAYGHPANKDAAIGNAYKFLVK